MKTNSLVSKIFHCILNPGELPTKQANWERRWLQKGEDDKATLVPSILPSALFFSRAGDLMTLPVAHSQHLEYGSLHVLLLLFVYY